MISAVKTNENTTQQFWKEEGEKFIEENLGLKIKIDTSIEEPEALITAPRMSEEVNKIVDYIGRLNGNRW